MINLLESGLQKLGISYNEDKKEKLFKFYRLLTEWNSFMNLTSITEPDDVVTKHFIDSLSIVKVLPDIHVGRASLIDIGTGAGFPGIPLGIMFDNLDILLLDSRDKKVRFLDMVVSELGLKSIKAVHARAEELAKHRDYTEKYDICVARAVAKMDVLSGYCLPYVKAGGSLIVYKSGSSRNEFERARRVMESFGGTCGEAHRFVLPDSDIERVLYRINKDKRFLEGTE